VVFQEKSYGGVVMFGENFNFRYNRGKTVHKIQLLVTRKNDDNRLILETLPASAPVGKPDFYLDSL
jgi:hypothetical protein